MCKKFYLEVTEECAGELEKRGIGSACIMVVDGASTPRRHQPLLKALEEVTGVKPERIFSHESTRYTVLARTIYIHYAQIDGDGIERITNDIGRNRWATNFYLRDFWNKLEGDMEFKRAEARVAALLEADPDWCPPKKERPAVGKKKRRRKRRRRKAERREPVPQKQGPHLVQLELF